MSLGEDGPGTRTRMPEQHAGGTGRRTQPQPRRALVTVVGVVVLLIAALAFANRGGKSDGSAAADGTSGTKAGGAKGSSAASATAPTGQRPVTSKTAGIPAGFAHSVQGAQSAAANYAVALGGVDMFNAGRRHEIVATVYAPSVSAALQSTLDRAYSADAEKALGLTSDGTAPAGLTFVSRTVPVGAKVTASAPDAVSVDVWCTALSGLAGQGSTKPVSSSWFTVSEKLVWTAGDWKIQSSTQKQGPAPVNGDDQAATADEISGAVQQYGGFTYAR
ncbi:hypothetical protein VSR01_21595 [Actinacidiphila sp. DG2A-62]|uniref:hypothetical protein n=1 Tax=Actinacidiphila sp. DG2A-62 TaxID=3108821 RepID=UPI002DB64162|nr:hypothetical protein [Actinacidiphila sp. DG2A-62]MEC3995972.1 hypothetical protein [Actinacidiphila sp. DG2A-62]